MLSACRVHWFRRTILVFFLCPHELLEALQTLPNTAPGPGRVSAKVVKFIECYNEGILHSVINYSLQFA